MTPVTRDTQGSRSDDAVHVDAPDAVSSPLVFASPHSGRCYAPELTRQTRVAEPILRRSEDAYVDEIFADAPRFGAPLIKALFPRVFLDVNRERSELDPAMFDPPAALAPAAPSARAAAGLGVVPRLAADGRPLYAGPVSGEEASRRLSAYYDPYHAGLRSALSAARDRFGRAVLIDCHSMPSASARGADIVLGDRYGAACSRATIAHAEAGLRDLGFAVVRNRPYAGAYTTEHYGKPHLGVEALQVEINRGLYMDELHVAPHRGLAALRETMARWIHHMSDPGLGLQTAAE